MSLPIPSKRRVASLTVVRSLVLQAITAVDGLKSAIELEFDLATVRLKALSA